jgi:Fungal chitosanase of glycosyl hydrolase group 75
MKNGMQNIKHAQKIVIFGISFIFIPLTWFDSTSAVTAEPTATELTSLTQTCAPLSGVSKFSTDEGNPTQVKMCQLNGAIWFKTDLDIDCDGGTTQACKDDKDYQPDTSCSTSLGKPMDASNLPFIVLPQASNGWDESTYGIRCGTVGAVIFNNKIEYGVFADRGPRGVVGEASHAMAKRLGINPNPNTGGISAGVTYIVFTGFGAVSQPIEDVNKAASLGKSLATNLVAQNTSPQNTSTIKITKPLGKESFSVGKSVNFEGRVDSSIIKVKLVADSQWTLAEISANQGIWSAIYIFSGSGNRKISAIGLDSNGNQVATTTIILRIL